MNLHTSISAVSHLPAPTGMDTIMTLLPLLPFKVCGGETTRTTPLPVRVAIACDGVKRK
jgi:hypothetical protein